jgi:hypothetical protein
MTEGQRERAEKALQLWRVAVVAYHDEMRKYLAVEGADLPDMPPEEVLGREAVERLDELFEAAKAAQEAYLRAAGGGP